MRLGLPNPVDRVAGGGRFVCAASKLNETDRVTRLRQTTTPDRQGDRKYLADVAAKADELRDFFIMQFNDSVKHDQPVYQPYGAFHWNLNTSLPTLWPERLGRDLCIVDLDSRPMDSPGQIFGSATLDWKNPDNISGVSVGILQHWLYGE